MYSILKSYCLNSDKNIKGRSVMLFTQKFNRPVLTFSVAMFICAFSSFAQQSTGGLRGYVKDPNGAVILGATITVTDSGGKERAVATNAEGGYMISSLEPGKYIARANGMGFGPYENSDVTITAGRNSTLDINLTIGLKEEVLIQNDDRRVSTEASSGASALVLTGTDLNILSDDPDQLAADLQALVGLGGPDVAQFNVDGFDGSKLPPKSSIREVRINANPFAADQDYFGANRIDILTKPGTNKFSGQAFMNFNDESMNARNPFAPTRAPFQARLYGGSLGGPLIAKKASFFLNFERRDITENAVISATILDPSFNIIPFSQTIVTPQRRNNISARVDYQLNPKNTLVARFEQAWFALDNLGVGNFSLASRAFNESNKVTTLQLTETAVLSQSVLNETRFQYIREQRNQTGDASVATINVLGAFIGGGPPSGPTSNVSKLYELQNTTSWLMGNHTFKAGGRFRAYTVEDTASTNFGGTFTFASLEQYSRVLQGIAGARPAQFSIAGGNLQASSRRLDVHLYLQDDWRAAPNLMLSFGLRYQEQTRVKDKLNLGPRFSFAWAPGSAAVSKTVIRGGGGIFYFSYNENLMLLTNRLDGINQQQFIISNPNFFEQPPSAESLNNGAFPQTVRRADTNLTQPYSFKGSLSVERQLPYKTTLSVAFIYERDLQRLRSRNLNAPLPGTFNPAFPNSIVRPNPNLGNIFVFESGATNTDKTLFIRLNSRFNKRVSVTALVGLSAESGDSDGPLSLPANSYDLSTEYASVLNDIHTFTNIGINYEGPWGLSFSSLIRAASANRFNITTGRDTNGDSVFTERPAFATDLNKPGVVITRFGAFDPNPEPGQSMIPRNFGKGPDLFQVNLRVAKTIRFNGWSAKLTKPGAERYGMTFSVQAQNIFNRTNFGPYIGNLNSPQFGQANSTAITPRRIDLQIRFSF
jgi:carboxypeptidase family protein